MDRRSLTQVLINLLEELRNIVRAEANLAGQEFKQKAQKAVKAGPPLAGAAVLGLFGAAAFVVLAIAALSIALPVWLAALLMGVVLGAGAGGAFLIGRFALDEVEPFPQRTAETLKDNVDWAKDRLG